MFKKLANSFIAVILTLTMLGATVGMAAAKSNPKHGNDIAVGDKVNMSIQGAGVMTRGGANFEGDLKLSRAISLDKEDVLVKNIRWATNFLNVKLFSDEKGVNHEHLNGNAFIFFDIAKGLDSAVKGGRLSIYKFDEARGVWVRLGTHTISTSIKNMSAAITHAMGAGTYGLGWAR
jgi:hypothetical protein